MYGCQNNKTDRLKERIFPHLFSKRSEHFSMANCNFQVQKARETTARVVMWREFHLINSFTLECSFCGPNMPDTLNPYNDCHFTISTLRQLGKQFSQTLVDYSRDESKVKSALSELEALNPITAPVANGQNLPKPETAETESTPPFQQSFDRVQEDARLFAAASLLQ